MSANEPRTLTELSDYIQSLVAFEGGGSSGYEASADAMWKAALAAFNLAAREVGATGFQASWAALRFYGEAMHVEGPFMVIQLRDAIYPQYDLPRKVREFMAENRDWIADQARERLSEFEAVPTHSHTDEDGIVRTTPAAHPDVVAHWRSLVASEGVRS